MKKKADFKEYHIYAGGEFIKTKNIKDIVNPYNKEVVGRVHFADGQIINKVVDFALAGFEEMRKLPAYKRAEILEKISAGFEKRHLEISKVLCGEAGKPIKLAKAEVSRCALTFKTAAEEAKRINGEILPLDWAESAKGRTGIIRRFPIGVILGITPFNFPLNLAAHKIAPALAAGNSIIIKPASLDPMSALNIAELAHEAGIPKGALQVIPADSKDIKPLIADERIKMITFTGSAEVGWKLKENSGRKKVTLELGGNAGAIIDKGSNLEYACERVLMGGFAYAGQVCISVQRVIIHEDIYEKFTSMLVEGLKNKVKVGDPADEEVLLSAMIEEKEAVRVESWIKEAVNEGAKILTGGSRHGSIVQPAIIANIDRAMKIYKDEIFGPVILVEPFKNFDEAVKKINDSRFGLQAGVFTPSLENAMYAFDSIHTSAVMINDVPTFRIDHMPYGGIKDSGFGREGIKYAIEEMTELKLMVINRQ